MALRRPNDIGVCAVTIAEFVAGLRPHERARWQQFIDSMTCWDVTRDIATQAGYLQYDYACRGHTVRTVEALIAAAAVVSGSVIVTDNLKDFPMAEVSAIRPIELSLS